MSKKVSPVVLPPSVTPAHYSLEISPDLERLEFLGTEDIDVIVSADTNQITVHSKEIHVLQASFASKDASEKKPKLVQISYHLIDNTVTFTFDGTLPHGNGVLHIEFRGILNGDMAGFYKSSYADADGKKMTMASTQFEALDARRAFPCWDEPAAKATFSVSLIVPFELTAISNMPELRTQNVAGGKKRVDFEVSPKMSTYLLAWAVGKFDYIQSKSKNGVLVRVFSPPGRAEHGRFGLNAGVKALDFYDDFFSVPYPLPKLDMLCCTEFAMGAMENWGLVTYREVDLMIDEAKASSQQKQRVAIVVAHELAHQWFGNLVTMAWWDDLWLNEGFASYMEHLAVDALFPSWNIWEQFTTDAMGAALRLDSLRSSHPIQVPIGRAEEVEQVFDAISYCKGSTVIRQAASVLGADNFRKGLQIYMARHKYSNTVTTDLWNAWSEASGIDMPTLMATWTEQMGYPYLTIVSERYVAESRSVELELEQNWFLTDGSSTPEENAAKIWSIPLIFATSQSVSDVATVMSSKRQRFSIPVADENDWIKINAGQQSMVRVSYSSAMFTRMLPAIRSRVLSPVDRAALLLDAYALAKAGLSSPENVIRALIAFENEDNSTVWTSIEMVLNGLNLIMEHIGGESYAQFKRIARKMVKTALLRVGWDNRPDDGHVEKLLRSTVIAQLDTFCYDDEEILAEAKRRFDAHWSDPAQLSSDYKTTVYKIILKNSTGSDDYEKILKTFYETEDNAERKFAMHSLGAASSRELKLRTLDWAVKSGDVKLQDFFYPIRAVASNVEGAELTWDYLKNNFEHIKGMLAKASPSLMDAVIINSISRFITSAHAEEISSFFDANPVPSSERRIGQAVESIHSTGKFLQAVLNSDLSSGQFWSGLS